MPNLVAGEVLFILNRRKNMSANFELNASLRQDKGKGASRRLRRDNKVPAVIYGGGSDPVSLLLDHDKVMHSLENEAFYSHILDVKVDGKAEKAVLKDLQRHPYRRAILHLDLLRVNENEKLRMHVPLHFIGADVAPGVKTSGGVVSHLIKDVEVSCLPKDLPEFIEADLSNMNLNETLHLSDLKLASGIELVELSHGEDHDQPVVSIHLSRVAVEVDEVANEGEGEGEDAAAGEGETSSEE